MNRSLVAALLGLFVAASWLPAQERGGPQPKLIARSEKVFVHGIPGGSNGGFYESVMRSGVSVTVTHREDGRMETILSTGVFSIPTRRISYSASRLLGTATTEDHVYCLLYGAGRLLDRPPYTLPSAEANSSANYYLYAIDLRTGQREVAHFHFKGEETRQPNSVELPHAGSLPAEFPEDKFDDGLLSFDEEGRLLVFGCRLTLENGLPVKAEVVE